MAEYIWAFVHQYFHPFVATINQSFAQNSHFHCSQTQPYTTTCLFTPGPISSKYRTFRVHSEAMLRAVVLLHLSDKHPLVSQNCSTSSRNFVSRHVRLAANSKVQNNTSSEKYWLLFVFKILASSFCFPGQYIKFWLSWTIRKLCLYDPSHRRVVIIISEACKVELITSSSAWNCVQLASTETEPSAVSACQDARRITLIVLPESRARYVVLLIPW